MSNDSFAIRMKSIVGDVLIMRNFMRSQRKKLNDASRERINSEMFVFMIHNVAIQLPLCLSPLLPVTD